MNSLRITNEGENPETHYRDLSRRQTIELNEAQKCKIAYLYSGRRITRVLLQRDIALFLTGGGDILRVTKSSWYDAIDRYYDQL